MSPNSRPNSGHAGYLFAGFSSLFVVAFLDNIRGPILPVLCANLGIPYETAGLFLTIGSLMAIVVMSFLNRLLRNKGERWTAIAVTLFATFPGWEAPTVDSRIKLLVFGAILGASVALIGSICSILTVLGSPPAQRGRFLAFQHVMYGLGSMTAPVLFATLFTQGYPWWWLLRAASVLLLGLSVVYGLILPRREHDSQPDTEGTSPGLDRWSILLMVMFACYVAGEVLASMWMTSLLVAYHKLSPSQAARYLTGFFIVLAATRFLCFLFVRPKWETKLLVLSLILAIVASLLGSQGHAWALSAMGILGPFFPLCMARVSVQFPKAWKEMTLYVYTTIQAMLAIMHLTVGKLADNLGMQNAFYLAPSFLFVALFLLLILVRQRTPTLSA